MMNGEDRREAVQLLIEVLQRTLNPAEHSDIEAWMDVRSEDEGGFLWLTALLNVPPRWLDAAMRVVMQASPRERDRLRKRLLAFNEAAV
jgi:AcrR family transcriptional regulator